MQAENSEEFYDVSVRNKKYGRVDAINGPVLLEKYVYKCKISWLLKIPELVNVSLTPVHRLTGVVQSPAKTEKFTALSRFGIKS